MFTSPQAGPRRRRQVIMLAIASLASVLGTASVADASPVTMALPATRAELNLSMLTQPHHDYPAVDIPLPAGATARAIFNGRATWVGYEAGGCGYGVTLAATTADGTRLEATYCHARVMPSVSVGQVVNAFQPVLSVGSTGASSGPHLHIQVKRNGVKVCPQPGLRAAWNQTTYDWNHAPTTGCTY